MAGGLLLGLFRYGETELDPPVQAEILLESARNEARVAILEIVIALGFGVYYGFFEPRAEAIYLFCALTVLPLLLDAQLRRTAAKRLLGSGPRPLK